MRLPYKIGYIGCLVWLLCLFCAFVFCDDYDDLMMTWIVVATAIGLILFPAYFIAVLVFYSLSRFVVRSRQGD
ncbi:hypothetical protein GCM10023310_27950 [Paenibacillus vulneris]|uniref:Uncharacterized protein n=1 Tax=Paenibacillus vulneris TaxID=1133364 RepID=A0ABW3UQA9_9BACL